MYFLRLIRFKNILLLVLINYLARIFLIKTYASNLIYIIKEKEIFILTCCVVLTSAAGYIINDYYDIKIDLINKPNKVIIGKFITRRWSLVLHTLFNLISIGIAGIYLSLNVAIFVLFCGFLLWFYSNYLKRTVFWGNLCIAFLAFAPFIMLGLYYQRNKENLLFFGILSFLTTLVREIIKDIEDIKGDKQYGCETLPIYVGISKTKIIALLLLTAIILLIFMSPLVLQKKTYLYLLFICLPCWIFFSLKLNNADNKKHFSYLSKIAKVFMFLGIIGMILV